jgi:hypothetical protein
MQKMKNKTRSSLFLKGLILSLTVFLCVSSSTLNFESRLKSEIDLIQNDLYSSINVVESESNEILIEIVFNYKKVVHKDHQQIIIFYALSQIENLDEFKSLRIKYYTEDEVLKNRNEINMSYIELEKILNRYNGTFELMLLKCLKEFDSTTIYILDAAISNVNRRYPDETLESGFANLLFQFSEECSEVVETKNAMTTVVTIFVAIRTFNNSESNNLDHMGNTLTLISGLWTICKKENIEEAEKRLFGKSNNVW